jgi:hypothetical protein
MTHTAVSVCALGAAMIVSAGTPMAATTIAEVVFVMLLRE